MKIFQNRKNYAPYLSDTIKKEMSLRNEFKQQSLHSNDPGILVEYKILRNRIRAKLRKEKSEYYSKKLADIGNNSKQLWKTSYQLLGQNRDLSPKQIIYKKSLISSPELLAESFNEIFIEKVQNVKAEIVNGVAFSPVERLINWLRKRDTPVPSMNFRPISVNELKSYVKMLKGGRSSGVDDIDSFSLKIAAPLLEDVLLHLVNLTITRGCFADCWKVQLIHPFFKKGDRCIGENYRPVSNIPEVSKLVEYAILHQLLKHFQENDLIHQNHHGFLPSRSTLTALLQIYDMWLSAAENRELSAGLFLDLSSAFDIIDHGILFQKLQAYGLTQSSVCFFKSYLTNRQQKVQVQSKISQPKPVGDQGVPQGSILGPILFLVYMNDFPEHSDLGEDVLYADDDTGHVHAKEPEELVQKLQAFADNSISWIKDNMMVCSNSKTKLLVIATNELRESKLHGRSLVIKVGDQYIQESDNEKLLGVRMSHCMSWNAFLYGNGVAGKSGGLLSQLSQRIGMLKIISKYMNPVQLNSVINGLFTSKLLYCLPLYCNVWGTQSMDDTARRFSAFTKEDMRRLQVLQNRVLRLKSQNHDMNTPTAELVQSSGDLSVNQLGAFYTVLQVFKIINSGLPKYLSEKLIIRRPNMSHIFPQRQLNTIQVKNNLSLSRSGFLYRGAQLWNSLPLELRALTDLGAFKHELRSWVSSTVPVKPR